MLICEANTTNPEAVCRTQSYAQNVVPAMSIPRGINSNVSEVNFWPDVCHELF
jgi:hypothetical protein